MKNQSRIYKLLLGVALIAELVCFAPDVEAQTRINDSKYNWIVESSEIASAILRGDTLIYNRDWEVLIRETNNWGGDCAGATYNIIITKINPFLRSYFREYSSKAYLTINCRAGFCLEIENYKPVTGAKSN